MSIRLLLAILGLTLSLNSVSASELEEEDIANETDAAVAENAEVKRQMARDRAASQRRYEVAKKAHNSAAAKRQASIDQMKKVEADIARFEAERVRMNKEVEKFEHETLVSEQATEQSRLAAQKLKTEIANLQTVVKESQTRLATVNAERDKVMLEQKEIENQKLVADQDFQKQKDLERVENEALEKLRMETAQKKAKNEAYIAGLKERYQRGVEQMAARKAEMANMERESHRMEALARTAEDEVATVEGRVRAPTSAPAVEEPAAPPTSVAANDALQFKRKCRVFDGPKKGSKVLQMQDPGVSVEKSDEGRSWISFKLSDGRKGYAAKGCFR